MEQINNLLCMIRSIVFYITKVCYGNSTLSHIQNVLEEKRLIINTKGSG